MIKNEEELLTFLIECEKNCKYHEGLKAIDTYDDLVVKKYYDIIRYKISFLMQLDKLIDAMIIIKEELKVPYVPADFEKFLKERSKEINFALRDKQRHQYSIEEIENIDKLDNETLLSFLPHLKEFNLRPYINKFQIIFNNPNISNLIKSLLIASLSDYKLDANFNIVKEETLIKFNPISVFDIRESENVNYVNNELKRFNDLEINTVDLINRLVMTYLLAVYPLLISEDRCDCLIAASMILASTMLNEPISIEKYDRLYTLKKDSIDQLCEEINKLLENI